MTDESTVAAAPEPDLERARRLVELAPWKAAESYASTAPHEYTVRHRFVQAGASHADFNWLIGLIYETGWRGRWHQTRNRYLTIATRDGEWQLWAMGWAPAETIVLNRADLNGDPRSLAERVGEPRRCNATTKAGRLCKNTTDAPYLYCHVHAGVGPAMTEGDQLRLLGEVEDFDWEAP